MPREIQEMVLAVLIFSEGFVYEHEANGLSIEMSIHED